MESISAVASPVPSGVWDFLIKNWQDLPLFMAAIIAAAVLMWVFDRTLGRRWSSENKLMRESMGILSSTQKETLDGHGKLLADQVERISASHERAIGILVTGQQDAARQQMEQLKETLELSIRIQQKGS